MKIIMMILCSFFVLQLSATIINIPADQPTIQAGIGVAVDGDSVLVHPGTYIENINFLGKAITVGSLFLTTQNPTYIEQTIIDGSNPSNPEIGSAVTFDSGEDNSTFLNGLTIQGGKGNVYYYWNGNVRARCGGGISCIDSSPIILNNKIQENIIIDDESLWTQGAGIYLRDSSTLIISNVITDNELPGYGTGFMGSGIYGTGDCNGLIQNNTLSNNFCSSGRGCIYITSTGQITIINNTISGNLSDGIRTETGNPIIAGNQVSQNAGNGIYCNMGNPIIMNNLITDNTLGIFCKNSFPEIIENIIKDNHNSDWYGGGIRIRDPGGVCQAVIRSNFIHNNSSGHYGGGLWCSGQSIVVNNLICNNSSINGGAIYASDNSSCIFLNNTICNNYAESQGGGLFFWENALSVNNIIWGNTASFGKQIYIYDDAQPEFYYCNIEGNVDEFEGPGSGVNFNPNHYLNNLSSIPFFMTPTEGIGIDYDASDSDWSLLPVTQIINSGILDSLNNYLPEFDLNGNNRIYGDLIDIGAYETQIEPFSSVTSFNVHNNYFNIMIIDFTTLFETNLMGFNIYHNTTYDFSSSILINNSVIPATNTNEEQIYILDEFDVEPGTTNYFWLEVITLDGDSFFSTFISKKAAHADFIAEPTWGTPPMLVEFSDLSVGEIMNWSWDFDNDGVIDSNDQNPTYTYFNQGTYSVSLTVSDSLENENTLLKENYITVQYVSADNDLVSTDNILLTYPNPFNPSTTIEFSIQNESKIELSIFNIKGQKIKTLADNKHSQGSHSIVWNGDDEFYKPVSSGIYFYKLNVNGKTEAVNKCLLLK